MRVERPGTTAYLKLAWHAPAVADPDFLPMLVLDAALTGAKGVNLWASFRNPPQRSARLYRALVETGLASSVFGALLPTEHPFLYTRVAARSARARPLAAVEAARSGSIERVRTEGITAEELSARGTSSAPGWCSSPTVSPTSPTRSGTSTPSRASTSIREWAVASLR